MSGTVVVGSSRALGPAPLPNGVGLLLGRGRGHLREVLGAYPAPNRIVSVERDPAPTVDLEQAFPDATVWEGALGEHPEWSGWPDLLWLGFALSAAGVEPAQAVAQAWRAMPVGALVACVDVEGEPQGELPAVLLQRLGLQVGRDTLGPLRRTFVPLEVSTHAHPGGLWRTYSFIGRKGLAGRR